MSETTTAVTNLAQTILSTPGHVRIRGNCGSNALALASQLVELNTIIEKSAAESGTEIMTLRKGFATRPLIGTKLARAAGGQLTLNVSINNALTAAGILRLTFVEHIKDDTAMAALQEIIDHNTLLGQPLTPGLKIISIVNHAALFDQLKIPTTLAL